jgi:hypothetical protein
MDSIGTVSAAFIIENVNFTWFRYRFNKFLFFMRRLIFIVMLFPRTEEG